MKYWVGLYIIAIGLTACGGSGGGGNEDVINTGNNADGSAGTFNLRSVNIFDPGEYLQLNLTGKRKNVSTGSELDVEMSITYEGRSQTLVNNILVTPVVSVLTGRFRDEDRGINIPISDSSTSYYDSDGVEVASDEDDGVTCTTTTRGSYPIAAANNAVGIGETEVCSDGSTSSEVWRLEMLSSTIADFIVTAESDEADGTDSSSEIAIRINNAGDILGMSFIFNDVEDGELVTATLSSSNSKNLQ